MAKLLFLVHRLPYPPNKGDKVRSYHLLKHLAAQHEVYLATFVDDPDDLQHVQTVRGFCKALYVAQINPRLSRLVSLTGLLRGEALTLRYYADADMLRWVRELGAEERFDAAVVFSSSMAQYARALPEVPMLVDFVDVDSAKWTQYAAEHRWPMSWIFRREGLRLLDYERQVAAQARASFFVTDREAALFRHAAPESAARVETICNGVDADYYAPDDMRSSPFEGAVVPVVFTGAMDYWPNVDAVSWFVQEMLPALAAQVPQLRFYIVGRSPTSAVQALASPLVTVTGTVPDVRPYLQHAAVVVAPLRLARGIQNKVLEAMAMARPVVAARACVEAIEADPGVEIESAAGADDFVAKILALLLVPERARRMGLSGRARVAASYSWLAHLSRIDQYLGTQAPVRAAERGVP